MVVGLQNKIKIGFLIQARLGSERLPGKVLMPLPNYGTKCVLGIIIDQLNSLPFNKEIIVLTTKKRIDNKVVEFCSQNNVSYYRGSEKNVFARFIDVIDQNNFNLVVRITGDNPIINTYALVKLLRSHIKKKADYSSTVNLPLGLNLELFNPKSLLFYKKRTLTKYEKEHVTIVLKNNSSIIKNTIKYKNNKLSKFRLTLDYSEDYFVLSTIFAYSQLSNKSPYQSFVNIAEQTPWIFEVNKNCKQK